MAVNRSVLQPPLDGRDFRRLMDGQLKEADWQKQVEEALDVCGWWWMHIPSNVVVCPHGTKIYRGIAKGFPDILALRPPHILWIELKRDRGGHLESEQRRVGAMLEACGQTWLYARPRDRERLLNLIAHPEAAA
jgi:hypothetical protein